MAIAECVKTGFSDQQGYGMGYLPVREYWSNYGCGPSFYEIPGEPVSPGIIYRRPISKEMDSNQTIEVVAWSISNRTIARTALGRKLSELRNRAIAAGMKLLNEDEILEEVKRRRGELPNDEADIY